MDRNPRDHAAAWDVVTNASSIAAVRTLMGDLIAGLQDAELLRGACRDVGLRSWTGERRQIHGGEGGAEYEG